LTGHPNSNDDYEFTYEIQYLTVPYARDKRIPLHPIDWDPSIDDQLLGFGLDLDHPPVLRPPKGFQSFFTVPLDSNGQRGLFFADSEIYRAQQRTWYEQPATQSSLDLPRRLFL
jgi:hypothetical protein